MSIPLPIPLSATVKLIRDKSRIFPHIADILAFQALVSQAWVYHSGDTEAELTDDSASIFACLAAKMDLRLSLRGFQTAALTGEQPNIIEVITQTKRRPPDAPSLDGLTSISVRLMSAAFALAADRMVEWVENNITTDRYKFPPHINFGRVIRNAIVHGYTINIKSPTAPVVAWRGLKISNKDYGRALFNGSLVSGGDLILLMIEMEAELNDLGAPFDLG